MRSLLIIAFALLLNIPVAAQVTVLTHAMLIDGSGAPPQRDTAIVMEAGRIRALGPSAQVTIPQGADVVDVSGRFIVPGIINSRISRTATR